MAELRAELAKLGMDTKGTKPILLARLKEALANMPEEGTFALMPLETLIDNNQR